METPTCRAHDRKTGQPCTAPPHANTGLCSKHGGHAVEKSIATNTKHSLFARILPEPLTDFYQAAHSHPDAVDLQHEIALLRAFLAHYVSTFQDENSITEKDLDKVGRHTERISRLLVRQSRLLADAPDRITKEDATEWTRQVRDLVVQVLGEFLGDAETCNAAFKRLNALMVEHELLPEAYREQPQEPDSSLEDGSPSLARDECARSARERSSGTSGAERRLRAGVGPGVRSDPPQQERIDEELAEPQESDRPPLVGSPSLARNECARSARERSSGTRACRGGACPAHIRRQPRSGGRPGQGGGQEPDQSPQTGSPFPGEERATREGGQGVRPEPDSRQVTSAPPSSYESLLLSLGIDPRDYPAPRRRCCAHDYNIMRRCEHPPMPGSYNCERHQHVPPAEEYIQSENQYM